jgi:hypothetical protein
MPRSSQIAAFQKVPPTFFSDCYSSIPKGATHLLRGLLSSAMARVSRPCWACWVDAEAAVLGGLHVAIFSSRTEGQIVKGNTFLKGH